MRLDINKIVSGKRFRTAMIVVGGLGLATILFQAGIAVGQQKTEHAFRWNENYQSNFGPGMISEMPLPPIGPTEMAGHGVVGEVIMNNDEELIVKGRDNTERAVTAEINTKAMRCRKAIEMKEIRERDRVTVIGKPDDHGRTKAKFIRVMPEEGCWKDLK